MHIELLICNVSNFKVSGPTKMLPQYEKLNDQVVHCPKHFVDIAAHLDTNPDPYFDSSYNWYYAGNGNLHIICINWVDYLLHSEFSNVCKYVNYCQLYCESYFKD